MRNFIDSSSGHLADRVPLIDLDAELCVWALMLRAGHEIFN
jgi:hypothetical protein